MEREGGSGQGRWDAGRRAARLSESRAPEPGSLVSALSEPLLSDGEAESFRSTDDDDLGATPVDWGAGTTKRMRVSIDKSDVSDGALGKEGEWKSDSELGTEEPAAWKRGILVTIPAFMTYAILVSFQAKLKRQIGISDSGARSNEFSFAVSFLYILNLCFRLSHNFVFAWVVPRNRVFVAMISLMLSMLTIIIPYYLLDSRRLGFVYIAYALGGVGIGSFESNFLSAITPLGHPTKHISIQGFPLGFAMILVGAFLLHAAGVPTVSFYILVVVALACGMAVFSTLPNDPISDNAQSLGEFVDNMRGWREFLPLLPRHAGALMVDMFFVSLMSGLLLYIMDADEVPLLGTASSASTADVSHDLFFAATNVFTLIGDTLGRRVVYRSRPRSPLVYLLLSFVGAGLCVTKVAILAWPGMLLVYLANGLTYAEGARHCDTAILKQFNLVSLSVWLFIGDVGSVAGSNSVPYVRDLVCRHHGHYICKKK